MKKKRLSHVPLLLNVAQAMMSASFYPYSPFSWGKTHVCYDTFKWHNNRPSFNTTGRHIWILSISANRFLHSSYRNMISSFISTQDTEYSADVTWFHSITYNMLCRNDILQWIVVVYSIFLYSLKDGMTKYRRWQHMVDMQIEGHRIFNAEWND